MAEVLFGRALELPSGKTRADFVAEQCTTDPELRHELESLLRAHEEAGDFLESTHTAGMPPAVAPPPMDGPGRTPQNPAALAAVYLQSAGDNGTAPVGAYLAGLPDDIRREAQERIEAGLRVRSVSESTPLLYPAEIEPAPHFPGTD